MFAAAFFGPDVMSAQTQRGDATAVLAAARQALGGDKKLSAVKTVTATGRTRQVRGDNLVPMEFEIFIELPDKYVRKEEIPAQETGVTATGFNGDEPVQDPPPPRAAAGVRRAPAGAAGPCRIRRAARVHAQAGLHADAMFASSFPAYLTSRYRRSGSAAAAPTFGGKGTGHFTGLFISRDTHLPLMVSWDAGAPQRDRGGGRVPGCNGCGGCGAVRRGAGPQGTRRARPPRASR
jgi:hypothetical protein